MRESRFQTVIYIVAAIVALGGLVEATYLTVLALTGGTALCGGSSDCFKVLGSPYARPGGIPIAAAGMLAYFAVFSFVAFAAFGYARAHALFALTVAAMFLTTLWLLFVQAFLLHAFCRYCLVSASAIFFLSGLVIASPAPLRWRKQAPPRG
jgi:uncharacterized membrane protein